MPCQTVLSQPRISLRVLSGFLLFSYTRVPSLPANAAPKRVATFDDPNWIFELKYDGFRALAMIERGRAQLLSRNGEQSGSKQQSEQDCRTVFPVTGMRSAPSAKNTPLRLRVLVLCTTILCACLLSAAQVPVRHKEGLVHGFLALRTLQGEIIADGDLIQNVHGDVVTSHLVFHFKDGSLHDDTAVFSQRGTFRLLKEHLIQKGPAFERPMEVMVDGSSGQVTVRYTEDGKAKTSSEHLAFTPDIANGMMLTLLKNILPDTSETKLPFVIATPKPRLVKLAIRPQGEEAFSTGEAHRKAIHYVVKVEIGGLSGTFASLLGKEPPDTHVWILEGEAPAFVKSEGPLAPGGPIWRIELVSPVWPRASTGNSQEKK
jgi:hypothetical protein